jgi:hypothetical protein
MLIKHRVRGHAEHQPSIVAGELEDAAYVRVAGLYAFIVVPRAPNFCALRRVSSNLERA